MKRLEKGFTLIELVVVITILGILAAFAIPRFAGLESSARAAAVNGLAGSLRAAAALAHSVQLVNGYGPAQTVTMEGSGITMVFGYPTGDNAGITAALQDVSGFDTSGDDGTFIRTDAPSSGANCRVTYTAPVGANQSPTITPDTGTC